MGNAIDCHRTHSTDAFPAIVVEGDGFPTLGNEFLGKYIHHLEERGILRDVIELVFFEITGAGRVLLAPDLERELHRFFHGFIGSVVICSCVWLVGHFRKPVVLCGASVLPRLRGIPRHQRR